MKLSSKQLYKKLVDDYQLIGQTGVIQFTLKDFTIKVVRKDTIGNLIQEWIIEWMRKERIEFEEHINSQSFPDVYLDMNDRTKGLLEIKSFDIDTGPGFDLANFDSYCNSLLENSHHLDCDYLIMAYQMNGFEITIKNVWFKGRFG